MSSAIEKTRQVEPLPLAGAEQKALREVWGNTLVELSADYPNLVVLDGDPEPGEMRYEDLVAGGAPVHDAPPRAA